MNEKLLKCLKYDFYNKSKNQFFKIFSRDNLKMKVEAFSAN